MNTPAIVERERTLKFAKALVSCYSKKNDYKLLLDEARSLLSFFMKYKEFEIFLSSPKVKFEKKQLFLKELIRIFAIKQRYFYSAIDLLFKSDLIKYISLFLEHLIHKLEWEIKRVHIKLISSKKLSRIQLSKLTKSLESKFGKSIKLETSIDETLIAGIKLEYEDSVVDYSLARQLENIKRKLNYFPSTN